MVTGDRGATLEGCCEGGCNGGLSPLAKGRAVYRAWLAGIYNAQFPLNGRHFPPGIPDIFREVSGIPWGRYSGLFPENIRNTIQPFPRSSYPCQTSSLFIENGKRNRAFTASKSACPPKVSHI